MAGLNLFGGGGGPGKNNWEILKNRKLTDTTGYRDVYNQQQTERSHVPEQQSFTPYLVGDIVLSIAVFMVIWVVWSIGEGAAAALFGRGAADMSGEGLSRGLVYYMKPTFWKFMIDTVITVVVFSLFYAKFKQICNAMNALNDRSDINEYQNDQHIALPEEIQTKFDWFPDVGCTSDVQFSSMISHVAISNKGLKKIRVAKRASKDIFDEDGDLVYHKGEVLLDENGNVMYDENQDLIDINFMNDLFKASGLPDDKNLRKFYNTALIPYNPDGSDRDKLGKFDTVADLINKDWELPYYEPQRPGGAYLVDTAPVNTMVLAITRAGKGQTVIEPTLDMWTRERRPNNMVINDPKGELLVKFYVRGTVRGFQIVQFNLINSMKTDIYNRMKRCYTYDI